MTDKLKVTFAPGVLEQLEQDLTPDDLQELMDELSKSIEDGSFFDESRMVDLNELIESDPELYQELMDSLDEIEAQKNIPPPTKH